MTIERFHLREELFVHGDLRLRLAMPRASEDLIDEAEFAADERIPYWAELWPSARALARELIDRDLRPPRAIELGCGLGLPSLVLAACGIEILATDYYADALEFVEVNALRNGIQPPAVRLLDWRDPPVDVTDFPLIIAADVLYETRNVASLIHVLERIAAPDARLILADPGRVNQTAFDRAATDAGWQVLSVMQREEKNAPGPPVNVRVALYGRRNSRAVAASAA